jgi:hypothetical protein
MHGMPLYDDDWQRKGLTPEERGALLKAAEDAPRIMDFLAARRYIPAAASPKRSDLPLRPNA